MRRKVETFALAVAALFCVIFASPITAATPAEQCRFIGIHRFADFMATTNEGARVLVSPIIKAPMQWNQLVASWNATTPTNTWVKVEARGVYVDRQTKYYSLGTWSMNSPGPTRASQRGQKDENGDVETDTLVLTRPGADVQLRVTLATTNEAALPVLRFLGLSFLDTRVEAEPLVSDRSAWGKVIPTPERSQNSYPQEEGWCSPTSLSMTLERWSDVLQRAELKIDVPAIAQAVFDPVYPGAGNWAFNCAFAGSFSGMRAYVTRLSDLTEAEAWINAGVPVVMSAPWHLLNPGRSDTGSGHLVVCIGFTKEGDVVVNDPATDLQKGQHVRHVYKRENVIRAWKTSRNSVYLIYPETLTPPQDLFGHWDKL